MNRVIVIFALLAFTCPLLAQQPEMEFQLKDSTSKHFAVSDIDSLGFMFTGDTLKLVLGDGMSAGGKDTIELKNVSNVQFVDSTKMAFIFKDTIIYKYLTDIDSMEFVGTKPVESGVVNIGSQVWAMKNLDVDHYRNGDPIPQVTDPAVWSALTTGAWCYYDSSASNGATYGKLYNWYAVNDPRGLAPTGFHIPSQTEWAVLVLSLGGDSLAGGKMKEIGTAHWLAPNTGACDSSGFTALPGGFRNFDGTFNYIGSYGVWWSSTGYDAKFSFTVYLTFDSTKVTSCVYRKNDGFSVRCVKD